MHIKTYEELSIIDKPQVGDYVSLYIDNYGTLKKDKLWENYINNSIGQIIRIEKSTYTVKVELSDYIIRETFNSQEKNDIIRENGKKYLGIIFMKYNILDFAETIEKLKIKIDAKKYNL